KAYVICSEQDKKFVNKILDGINNSVSLQYGERELSEKPDNDGFQLKQSSIKEMTSSDFILIVINTFFSSLSAEEVRYALYLHGKVNAPIFTIVFDESRMPAELSDLPYLKCEEETEKTVDYIRRIICKDINILNDQKPDNKYIDLHKHDKSEKLSNSFMDNDLLMLLFMGFVLIVMLVYIIKFSDISDEIFGWTIKAVSDDDNLGDINPLFLIYFALFGCGIMLAMIIIDSVITSHDSKKYSIRLSNILENDELYDSDPCKSVEHQNYEFNVIKLMRVNLENIRGYYTWSQQQARKSFALAVLMCMLGLVLITIAIVYSLSSETSIQASMITAIGGVVTELIAGTALVFYRKSMSQLNYYHQALHEDERFLSSVYLLNNFDSDEIKDAMLQEIIRSEIQMNVDSIKSSVNSEEKNTDKK
ncbi:MAG: hypothetical protein LUF92_13715, partial [Clostridiales bacterium]|nr:hypothetical protein [Clostridiales bacterium]